MISWGFLNFKKNSIINVPSSVIPPSPIRNTRWERIKYPSGVNSDHIKIVTYLGQIGFIAKGIVYAVMGGLCISTAEHLGDDVDGLESPMGAFIFLGLFTIGTPILVIMFVGLSFYSLWRFWEGGFGQGSDATRSPPSNFFRYRISPIVSGCVYIAYLSYIGKLLSTSREGRMNIANNSTSCFPACWGAGDIWHRMAVGVGGVAFIIAFITQVQNGFSNRWHADLMIHHCTVVEKYTILILGHLGFLGRAGVFMFVAVLMFRSLQTKLQPQRDTFSDAINQIIGVHGGSVGLWFLGIGLILFGIFAAGNAYYKYYPTPPPSRIGFPSKRNKQNHETPQSMSQNVSNHRTTRSSINPVNQPSTPPTSSTFPIIPLPTRGNSFNSDYDHRFSANTPVHDPATKESATTDEIRSASIDNMATTNTGERLSSEPSSQDTSRPSSPFLQTRRYRWQLERQQRNSNMV